MKVIKLVESSIEKTGHVDTKFEINKFKKS